MDRKKSEKKELMSQEKVKIKHQKEIIDLPANEYELSFGFHYIWIIIIVIIVISMIMIWWLSLQPEQYIITNSTILLNKTEEFNAPINNSLANYSNITNITYSKQVKLIGYLQQERIQKNNYSSYVYKYIMDDYGHRIRIFLDISSSKYESLFPSNGTTTDLYELDGLLHFRVGMLILEVNLIGLRQRPTILQNRTISEEQIIIQNTTIPSGFNITYGFHRIFGN